MFLSVAVKCYDINLEATVVQHYYTHPICQQEAQEHWYWLLEDPVQKCVLLGFK